MKLTFQIPNKKKFLIFDNNNINILKTLLHKSYNILHVRKEVLSIPVLIISLILNIKDVFKLRNLYFNYLKTYIKFSNPEIILTFTDNSLDFYKFKNFFKNIKFIAIQNGYRFYKNDFFENIEKKKSKITCDEYYCFGPNIKKYLEKKINSKFIINGSLKNNFCNIERDLNSKNICFISSFGITDKIYEERILSVIYKFCEEQNIKLEILPRRHSEQERDFYKSILNVKKYIYHHSSNRDMCFSYRILDKAKLTISLNASLGYENLSRGNKTLFLNINSRNLNCNSFYKFGYPEKFDDSGHFWMNRFDEKKIIEKIKKIYFLNFKEWNYLSKNITDKIIVYNKKNTKLVTNLNS